MQLNLKTLLLIVLICGLVFALVANYGRMRVAETELEKLRTEYGYLEPSEANEIAAVRVVVDEPLVWQARVRVPAKQRYRVAYSAVWRASTSKPEWFAAQPIPEGESVVTVRVMKDPRDDQWRISTIVRHAGGVGRIGTVLPEDLNKVFRGSHDVVSSGIGRQTVHHQAGRALRIFDERYFSGPSLLLYGDRAPEADVVGIFAELQPDIGPL
jgi:hypothetical protein